MGYVRSRKFCCCFPVRFGVFCMATIGVVLGLVISIAGWVQIHNTCGYPVHIHHEKYRLFVVAARLRKV